jgi:protein-S-isoprenylcysteine O-methyltransferase Ste14
MSKNEKTLNAFSNKSNLKENIFTTIYTISLIVQIILIFVTKAEFVFPILYYSGWIMFIISLYFAIIPFFSFKKRGGVEKGKSYVTTSKVVKDGVYAIVRHPQYLGRMLFSISITLWNPAWFNLVLSITIVILTYRWTYAEDKSLVEKFGEYYEQYKKKVPRLNPILGLIMYYAHKSSNS